MADESVTFSSPARVTSKWLGVAPEGVLTLEDGRLSFMRGARVAFDAPLESVTDITWPRRMAGTGVRFTLDGKRYTCTFDRLSAVWGGPIGMAAGLPDARRLARIWQGYLVDKDVDLSAFEHHPRSDS